MERPPTIDRKAHAGDEGRFRRRQEQDRRSDFLRRGRPAQRIPVGQRRVHLAGGVAQEPCVIGVSTAPGQTTFTRTDGREFHRQRLGHGDNPALRRHIRRAARPGRGDADAGANIDDRPAAPDASRNGAAACTTRNVPSRLTASVWLNSSAEVSASPAGGKDAGRIDHAVQAAQRGLRLPDRLLHRGGIGDIDRTNMPSWRRLRGPGRRPLAPSRTNSEAVARRCRTRRR